MNNSKLIYAVDTLEVAVIENELSILVDNGEEETGATLTKDELFDLIKFLQRSYSHMQEA